MNKWQQEVLTVSLVRAKHVITMSASPANLYISSRPPFLSTSTSVSAWEIFEAIGRQQNVL